MKKSLKLMLALFTLALGVLFAGGTDSKAATWNGNIKQIGAGTKSARIQWNPCLGSTGVGHYEVYISVDNVNWGKADDDFWGNDCTYTLDGLAPNSVYYVKIVAKTENSCYWDDEAVVLGESTSGRIATLPELGTVQNLRQTGATSNTITIAWNALAGAQSYTVYKYNSYNNYTPVATTTATSLKISGLSASFSANYFVVANAKNITGFTATSKEYIRREMRTAPAKVALVALSHYWSFSRTAGFKWSGVNNADGYQYQVLNSKGKAIYTNMVNITSGSISPFKKGQFTRTRVRAYIKVGNGYVYGPWSGYSYNAISSKVTAKRSKNRKKITVKWKKVTGASGYNVYVSTKSDRGFKKCKKVSKKKSSYTITKYGKKKLSKKKTYYVKVEYLTKVGKKTVKSGIVSQGSV